MPDNPLPRGLAPASKSFPWPVALVNLVVLVAYMTSCIERGVRYGLGAKAASLLTNPPAYAKIDCSGWVRAALAVATAGALFIPDGSYIQNDWCQKAGLKRSNFAALLLHDGILRICFIRPNRAHPIGHVFLVLNGLTLESYGGHGPGRRSPLVHVLHAFTTDVYVLALPGSK